MQQPPGYDVGLHNSQASMAALIEWRCGGRRGPVCSIAVAAAAPAGGGHRAARVSVNGATSRCPGFLKRGLPSVRSYLLPIGARRAH